MGCYPSLKSPISLQEETKKLHQITESPMEPESEIEAIFRGKSIALKRKEIDSKEETEVQAMLFQKFSDG
jgi:hypothetical protein